MNEASTRRPVRVVLTKVGLDGHDRGVKVIAQAGIDHLHAGLRRTPDEIARIVMEEDADVLGLSILSGAVLPLTKRVRQALQAAGCGDVLLVVGGIVPPAVRDELNALGITGLFGPGSSLTDITSFINENVNLDRAY